MNCAKLILAVVFILTLAVPLSTGIAEPQDMGKYPKALTVKIPMRDGKELAADIFLPKTEGKFPTILIMTPYNRKLLAAAIPAAAMKSKLIDRKNYAFVVVDWRGFYGSKDAKGEPEKKRSDTNGKDGYDTVEWIARQKWSDGKVGMWGSSALGKIQYMTAVEQPPHLVCICPMVTQHGYFYNRFYHGGVYRKCHSDILDQVGFTGAAEGIRKYPVYSNLWKYLESPLANKYTKLNIPILIIGGWYDTHTEGVLQTFNAIRTHAGPEAKKNIKMIIGPWEHCFTHAGPLKVGELEFPQAKTVSEKEAVRFFAYWLCGRKDNGYDKEPAVRYFQMGENKWNNSPAWPPAKLKELTYYLQAEGALSQEKPGKDAEPDTFRYDPNDPSPTTGGMTIYKYWDLSKKKVAVGPMDQRKKVESRKDHVAYSTEPLDKNVVVKDAVKVKLYVSSDRVDTDFAVRLCDVYPDGRSMLITDGIHRMRFRESILKEKLMEPGKVYEVTVVLTPTAHTFRKKHRIRILVSSSNYPRFDRNPNNGEHFLTDKKKALVATNKVYHDSSHLSALILPVPGDDEAEEPHGGSGLHKRTVEVDKDKRDYLLYVPKSYDASKAVPVVMMLHGGGGTGKAAMKETLWDRKAEKEGFLAVFPNATCPNPNKPPAFGANSPTWNDGSGRFHAGDNNVPDVKYLAAVLDDVARTCSVDDRRIYVTGFSNGSSMTFRAGAELSDRIAAIAPVSGAFWLKDARLKRPVPTLYMTGTADTLNPMNGGFPRFANGARRLGGRKKPPVRDSINRWTALLGCDKNPKESTEKDGVKRVLYISADKRAELVFITVEGMGHVWAGGDNKLPKWMIGSDPGKLDATDTIWNFFKKHKLPDEK